MAEPYRLATEEAMRGKYAVYWATLTAVLLSGGSFRSALPQEQTVNMMDGSVWPHLTEKERMVVVQGYIDGRRSEWRTQN
jgi:hypothetical protein